MGHSSRSSSTLKKPFQTFKSFTPIQHTTRTGRMKFLIPILLISLAALCNGDAALAKTEGAGEDGEDVGDVKSEAKEIEEELQELKAEKEELETVLKDLPSEPDSPEEKALAKEVAAEEEKEEKLEAEKKELEKELAA